MILRRCITIAVALGLAGCASAGPQPPAWAKTQPQDARYAYVVGTGVGETLPEAREKAIKDAYQTLIRTGPREYRSLAFRQQLESDVQESITSKGATMIHGTQTLTTATSVSGEFATRRAPRLEVVKTETQVCTECLTVTMYVLLRYPKSG